MQHFPDKPSGEVRIEKLVSGGDGLGYLDGCPVFVPLTAPGDIVVPENVRKSRGVLFARRGKVVRGSDMRRDPACPWYGECGGCQWMHLPYDVQLSWKEAVFSETVRRIGGFAAASPDRVFGSPAEFGYRYRVRFQCGGGRMGFYRRGTRDVVPLEKCLILPEPLNRAAVALGDFLEVKMVSDRIRTVELALDPQGRSLTVAWTLGRRGRAFPSSFPEAVETLLTEASVPVVGQRAIRIGSDRAVSRGGALSYQLLGCSMRASPGTFLQVNPWANEILVKRAMANLGPGRGRSLLDLYCGNGNFSLPAAANGFHVTGVDSSSGSVVDALEGAPDGCRFIAGDVAGFLSRERARWDAVVMDPPRTGLTKEVVNGITRMSAPVLLYVSCEPSTLARDLARLCAAGYFVRTMELVDMFPQTSHVESLTLLERCR